MTNTSVFILFQGHAAKLLQHLFSRLEHFKIITFPQLINHILLRDMTPRGLEFSNLVEDFLNLGWISIT